MLDSQPLIFDHHKSALRAIASAPFTTTSARMFELDKEVERIKAERPEAFLNPTDLSSRCFVHAPRTRVPHMYSLRAVLTPGERAAQAAALMRMGLGQDTGVA